MISEKPKNKIIIFTDGGARGNPGLAAAGVYLEIAAVNLRLLCGKYLGENTNNFAEYFGVILGLETVLTLIEDSAETEIDFFADSALVVNQLNGKYQLKAENLKPLFQKVRDLEKKFKKVTYTHVVRAENKLADKAVNEALDSKSSFKKELN